MPKKKYPSYSRVEKYDIARQYGFTAADARKIRSYGAERFYKEIKKKQRNNARNEKLQKRRSDLRAAGFAPKEVRAYQYRAQDFIEKQIDARTGGKMYVAWGVRDVTQQLDPEEMLEYLREAKDESQKQRERNIKEAVESRLLFIGSIGQYMIDYFFSPSEAAYYMEEKGYSPSYIGKGKNFDRLEAGIQAAITVIYPYSDRYIFLQMVIQKLENMDNMVARKNAEILRNKYDELVPAPDPVRKKSKKSRKSK